MTKIGLLLAADLVVVYTTTRAGWNVTSADYQEILVRYLFFNLEKLFIFVSLVKFLFG